MCFWLVAYLKFLGVMWVVKACFEVEVEVNLRPTVSPGAHLGPVTNFSFAMKFPVDSCGFVIL
jgi:hypothetical protein